MQQGNSNLGDYYFRKLPRKIQSRVEELLRELEAEAETDLVSVIAHGSVARAEWIEHESDIDLVVVLENAERATLMRIAEPLAVARAAARVECMVLRRDEIARAADVFPLFYQELAAHHIVLFGSDPFAGLAVEAKHLRLRVEQELRDMLIQLRRAATEARASDEALGRVVTRTLRRARFPLSTLHVLLGGDGGSLELPAVLARVGRRFDVDVTHFRRALERPDAAFDALVLMLRRAIEAVDRLELDGQGGRT